MRLLTMVVLIASVRLCCNTTVRAEEPIIVSSFELAYAPLRNGFDAAAFKRKFEGKRVRTVVYAKFSAQGKSGPRGTRIFSATPASKSSEDQTVQSLPFPLTTIYTSLHFSSDDFGALRNKVADDRLVSIEATVSLKRVRGGGIGLSRYSSNQVSFTDCKVGTDFPYEPHRWMYLRKPQPPTKRGIGY